MFIYKGDAGNTHMNYDLNKISCSRRGLTIIEIIVVVALMAVVMALALPQLTQTKVSAIEFVMRRMGSDFRSAFDMAVLAGKPYRMVFSFSSNEYWLEEPLTDGVISIGDAEVGHDLTEDEEKQIKERFKAEFEVDYKELAGEPIYDEETGREIKPFSPVLKAEQLLEPASWSVVNNMEWAVRDLGEFLAISEVFAEHHGQPQLYSDLGPEGRAIIYFFPNGYVERAYVKIYPTTEDGAIDEQQPPYVVKTNPTLGTVEILSSADDIEVKGEEF